MIDLVVLAAGRGKRLGALGDDTPKWLLEMGGRTIADRQLEAARHSGVVRSTTVVAGHAASAIERFVSSSKPPVAIVENPTYAEINNWYSLLVALRALPDDGRLVVFNADLHARPEWFESFLHDSASASTEALIALDLERPLTDESMKVSVTDGLLDWIGKVGVDDPAGEYVGMFMARDGARRALHDKLESFVGSEEAVDHWYEMAIGETASEGTPWPVWGTPDSKWIEIDDEADYQAALRLDVP